jgi:hypothetical protein
MMRTW